MEPKDKLIKLLEARKVARHELKDATKKYKDKVAEFHKLSKEEWKDQYNCTNADQRKVVIASKTQLLKENMDLIEEHKKYLSDVYEIVQIPEIGIDVLIDLDENEFTFKEVFIKNIIEMIINRSKE